MSKKRSVLVTWILVSSLCVSQENITINYTDQKIETIIENYKLTEKNTKINVYRIQLESSETPRKITKIKNQYLALFPLEIVEEVFEPPYFKVITGIYLDKKIAEKKLNQIKKRFRSTFIFEEEISIEKFKKSRENYK